MVRKLMVRASVTSRSSRQMSSEAEAQSSRRGMRIARCRRGAKFMLESIGYLVHSRKLRCHRNPNDSQWPIYLSRTIRSPGRALLFRADSFGLYSFAAALRTKATRELEKPGLLITIRIWGANMKRTHQLHASKISFSDLVFRESPRNLKAPCD